MSEYTFLFKSNSDERDCMAYINMREIKREQNYIPSAIDGRFTIHGPCYSMSFNDRFLYKNVRTILSEDEFNLMRSGKITESIFEKLLSDDNQVLFNEVVEEEKEHMMEEYGFSSDDIQDIFDIYYLDYRDRGIVSCVFDSIEDVAYEEAYSIGYATDENERWFDFDRFGYDLLNEERYLELSSGRVVSLNY